MHYILACNINLRRYSSNRRKAQAARRVPNQLYISERPRVSARGRVKSHKRREGHDGGPSKVARRVAPGMT